MHLNRVCLSRVNRTSGLKSRYQGRLPKKFSGDENPCEELYVALFACLRINNFNRQPCLNELISHNKCSKKHMKEEKNIPIINFHMPRYGKELI